MSSSLDQRLNVLQYICPTGYYGAERWIVALARNLDTDAVRCDLILPIEQGADCKDLVANYPSSAGKVFQIESRSRIDLSLVKKLVTLIKQRQIDVLHTHGYKSDIIGILAARWAGIPCISTPHGFGHTSNLKLKLFYSTGVFALRFFDAVVPLSTELLEFFKQQGTNKNGLRYIGNGVDTTEIDAFRFNQNASEPQLLCAGEPGSEPGAEPGPEPGPEPNTEDTSFTFGYIGRLAEGKEIDQMILAFDKLWLEHPEVRLELVGEGPLRADLESLASQLPSKDNIIFAGFQADRFTYLSKFDVFVMTSKSEGIPRSMMEAMAMGVAVVAYDIPGVDQLVTHGETGLLAPYGDQSLLRESMKSMVTGEAMRRQLAAAGQLHIERYYSAKSMADSYTELFRKILDKNEK